MRGVCERVAICAGCEKPCRARTRAATKPSRTIGPVDSQYGEWLRTIDLLEAGVLGDCSFITSEGYCLLKNVIGGQILFLAIHRNE